MSSTIASWRLGRPRPSSGRVGEKAGLIRAVACPGSADFALKLALLCVIASGAALAWGAAGALTQTAQYRGRLQLIQRIASVWLALVSISLIVGVVRA